MAQITQACKEFKSRVLPADWVIVAASLEKAMFTCGVLQVMSLVNRIKRSYWRNVYSRNPLRFHSNIVLREIQGVPRQGGDLMGMRKLQQLIQLRLKTFTWESISLLLYQHVAMCTVGEWMTKDNSESTLMSSTHLNQSLSQAVKALCLKLPWLLAVDSSIALSWLRTSSCTLGGQIS